MLDVVYSCHVTSTQTSNNVDEGKFADKTSLVERRRSGSLRAMRQSLSLPHPTSGSTLRMLIESRVQLPTWRRDTSTSSDRRDFFLDIVRDVSCELDLARLTRKMLANLATLASAESTSIYMMDTASRTWSAGDVVSRWRG